MAAAAFTLCGRAGTGVGPGIAGKAEAAAAVFTLSGRAGTGVGPGVFTLGRGGTPTPGFTGPGRS